MDAIYYYTGVAVVWFIIAVALLAVAIYAYAGVKALVMAFDFLAWYRYYSLQADPDWKPNFGPIKMYMSAVMHMWRFDKDSEMIHHQNYVTYKPFAWK